MSSAQHSGSARPAQSEIVGLGLVVVDLLAVVPAYPQVDTKLDIAASAIQSGGPVPTALTQLAKLGHRCRLLGRWGNDPFGKFVEHELRSREIAFGRQSRCSRLETGHSQVWVSADTGQRTSVTRRADEAGFALDESERHTLRAARLVHLDGWPPARALEAAELARSGGAMVSVDTGSPKPGIEHLLKLADVVTAPRRFAEEFLGERNLIAAVRAIASMGPSLVVVTDGERGGVMSADGGVIATPALQGAPIVDTNGAGDVFAAGVIHGVLEDWPPERILRFATAVAGWKCRRLGNREALADLQIALRTADLIPGPD
jgi:sulfofructose kinase